MAFRAAHAVCTNHVAQPAGWFTWWSSPSRPASEKAWATSTSSWMWPSSATPSPAPRHTAQEGRPGARGSPEQERRQGARRGSVLEVVEGQKEESQTLEEHGRRIMAIHVHGSTSRVHPVPGRGPADPRPDTGCAQRAGPVHMGYSISLRH